MDEKIHTHRKAAFWQVYLPLIVGSAAILGLGVWAVAVAAGGADVSRFADTSAVVLIIPVLVFSLIPLALLGLLIYGLLRLIQILPKGTARVRTFLDRVNQGVVNFSEKAVEPILRLKSIRAGLKSVFRKRR
jgi:hypothetical protein